MKTINSKMNFNPLDLAIEKLQFCRELGVMPRGWLIGTAALGEVTALNIPWGFIILVLLVSLRA